jgi:hypothetical protein
MKQSRTTLSAAAFAALGSAVNRVTAAAGLARAVADHVPEGGDFGKLDCLDAIELHLLRPAAAELQKAYQKACEPSA